MLCVAIAAVSFAVGCERPFVVFPGGELLGEVKPHPHDWLFSNAFETVQLETRPEDPYSVNIWCVTVGNRFLIASGEGMESTWAEHIAANPNVRLRIGDDIFELRAVRTDSEHDRRRFKAGARIKYDDFEPDEEQADQIVLFSLEPR